MYDMPLLEIYCATRRIISGLTRSDEKFILQKKKAAGRHSP
jgi:hypothetical protein